jgi:hypothetical protein
MTQAIFSAEPGILPEAFTRLDSRDPEQIVEYERAFFKGIHKVEDNPLIRQLLCWNIPAERISCRVPYTDQAIYVQRTMQGMIDTGIAINTTLRQFQAAAFGFPLPAQTEGICELLAFFSVMNRHSSVKIKFWLRCCRELSKLGFHTAYATCSPHHLLMFCRMGATVLSTAEIKHEYRYFLRFSVRDIAMYGRQVAGIPEIVCLN